MILCQVEYGRNGVITDLLSLLDTWVLYAQLYFYMTIKRDYVFKYSCQFIDTNHYINHISAVTNRIT